MSSIGGVGFGLSVSSHSDRNEYIATCPSLVSIKSTIEGQCSINIVCLSFRSDAPMADRVNSLQSAVATNSNLIVGNTGAVATGVQTANPVNVRA